VVVLGQPALRRHRGVGHRRLAGRADHVGRAVSRLVERRYGRVVDVGHALWWHRVVEQLGDAEVEQLGQELAGALDHHHVRRLEIAVHDAGLMRSLHDRSDALEERHELSQRHRAMCRHPLSERDPVNTFHGYPEQSVVLLDAKRVDVCGIGMVEPRREPGLAQKASHDHAASTQLTVQDLDDRFSSKQRLLAGIHGSETARSDSPAKDELSKSSPGQIVATRALVSMLLILVPVNEQALGESAELVLKLSQTVRVLPHIPPAHDAPLEQLPKPIVDVRDRSTYPSIMVYRRPGQNLEPRVEHVPLTVETLEHVRGYLFRCCGKRRERYIHLGELPIDRFEGHERARLRLAGGPGRRLGPKRDRRLERELSTSVAGSFP